jgi:hypothetical protein
MASDYLIEMVKAQRALQVQAYGGIDPNCMSSDDRIQFIKDMVLALGDEAHELLGEIGWKPWASSRHINREAAVGELIDMWHFFMNLMLVLGVDATELYERYMEKRSKNISRQQAGYDGISGKCPECKRALDDTGVFCTVFYLDIGGRSRPLNGVCAKTGAWVSDD